MQETKLERQDTKRTRLERLDKIIKHDWQGRQERQVHLDINSNGTKSELTQPDLVNYIHSTLSQMETELTKYEHEGIFLPV